MYAKVVLAGLLATLTHAGVLEPQYSAAAPSSVQYISHPVASAPVQYTPAPVQYAPAPVQYAPAPVQYAPAPVRYAPAPVQYAAAPVKYSVQPLAQPVVSNYVKAAPIQYAAQPVAPVAQRVPVSEDYNYDPNPQYEYGYDIQDGLTGDSKSQSETRQGDVVKGSYSVIDPDGHKRTVEYNADPVNGFNAVVTREPIHVKAVAPVQYAAKVPVASLYKQ